MISELFTDLDLDGSGTVDINEFLEGLQTIGLEGALGTEDVHTITFYRIAISLYTTH